MKYTKQEMQVGNNRLNKLAKLLLDVPEGQFNYNRWVGEDWEGKADLSCGTTACALGWATTIPSFRKLGLRLHFDAFFGHEVINVKTQTNGFDSAMELFKISSEDSEYLFMPQHGEQKTTAADVSEKISNFVQARQKVLNLLK